MHGAAYRTQFFVALIIAILTDRQWLCVFAGDWDNQQKRLPYRNVWQPSLLCMLWLAGWRAGRSSCTHAWIWVTERDPVVIETPCGDLDYVTASLANYDKIIFRFFMLPNVSINISGIITKYYRFINFRLIITKSDQGDSRLHCTPYSYATAEILLHLVCVLGDTCLKSF